jgi:hypothetical protein
MVSTRRPGRAEQVASNALRAGGGCIFADAPNVVTSAAVIVHQASTHRNTTPLRVTRSSPASSQVSIGFTTTAPKNSSAARSFTPLTRIRWINRRPDRPERCLPIGERCFTNRRRFFASIARQAIRSRRFAPLLEITHSDLKNGTVRDMNLALARREPYRSRGFSGREIDEREQAKSPRSVMPGYDAIIIGTGQAGPALARQLVTAGAPRIRVAFAPLRIP